MNKLTAKQILEKIEELEINEQEFGDFDFGEYSKNEDGTPDYTRRYLEGIGEVVEVEQHGGEGMGDSLYSVKHFVDHDVYIRTEGWYASYEGGTYDQGYGEEVRPTQRLVTFYE